MSNNKEREDPQPDRGNGPKNDNGGRPVDRGHPIPHHGSAASMPHISGN